jgi:hypothetical protein
MNSLVAYGSSDEDEDENDIKSPASASGPRQEQVNGLNASSTIGSSAGLPADSDNALMVGPTMPTDYDAEAVHQEQQALEIPSMAEIPEQDLIRHLTQASHPMTSLPSSPPGSPSPVIEAKFKKFLELKAKGIHFNEDLAGKSTFRNPALLDTLMGRAGIDGASQYASSLPAAIWNPAALPSSAYKEALARSQQAIREEVAARRKIDSKSGKRTIDFQSTTMSGTSSQHSTPGFRQKEGPT